MTDDLILALLGRDGLQRFRDFRPDAVDAVARRFQDTHGSSYQRFGRRGREACRADLAYHLEFLQPALEFGLLQPMVDYLRWLASVLAVRSIPTEHLATSLDWLAEFYADRMPGPDGAVVANALLAARRRFMAAGAASLAPPLPADPWPEAATFESALLAGSQRDALAVVTRCIEDGRHLVAIERHVIQPALYSIGDKWQANQVSVAQEHMATAIAQVVMSIGLVQSPPPVAVAKRVLLACVDGNNHAIGLRMVSDAFALAGWDVRYLGASVPTAALVQEAVEWKPDLVGLSVSFAQQLPMARDVIAQLQERLRDARPPVMIGGLAINRFDQVAGMLGADACSADAPAAVAYANRALPRTSPR